MSDERPHLTLLDLSDRELLLVLRDVSDGTGYALAADIADRLDIGEDGRRSVSSRMAWLTRYGAVERETSEHASNYGHEARGWKLTDLGLAIATGKLKKQTEKSLDSLDDGALLMTVRWVTQRMASSDPTLARLFDREYRHGTGRRR